MSFSSWTSFSDGLTVADQRLALCFFWPRRLLRCGLCAREDEAEAAERHEDPQEVHQQTAVLHPVLRDGI